ncbi:MAG TPA: MoaD/ThiS family protein, partial [Thermoanaerobaculia bacterium]|nr:MoaD/ThiS family protein [Thermoanaerobaculia bacterium]
AWVSIERVRIRVVAFATAARALGASERDWDVAPGATVADLVRSLAAVHPELARDLPRLAFAVDGELGRDDRPLAEGSEVALLPPVSGG